MFTISFDPLITACSDDGWSSEEVQGTAIQGAYSGNASASVIRYVICMMVMVLPIMLIG